jgi:metallopeptidase MepB
LKSANQIPRKGYHLKNSGRRYPTSAVLIPVAKPKVGEPCLLSQFEVTALLHETGHALHNIVSDTQYGLLHGTGVTRDFVEVHAMVVERFLTLPKLLRQMSCHYSHLKPEYTKAWQENVKDLPPKKLSDDLIAACLKNIKDFNFGRSYANVALCHFDMAVHNPETHESLEKMNMAETFNQIERDVKLLHGPQNLGGTLDWGCAFAHFKHLSGEYDAQYYTYLR